MNVLLVDDDRFVVAALERKIDWSSLSVSTVYTAHQIHQAKQILESNPVDICVCDIEMPGGSGLDLLSWVREHDLDVQFIFLTSYADFDYAQKAISLASLDYQLKPINFDKLYQILQKAVTKVNTKDALQKTQKDSNKWKQNHQQIIDLFWKNLFTNSLLSSQSALENELEKKDLSYQLQDLFLPVLFKLYPSAQIMEELSPSVIDFSFRNIASETLENSCILFESITVIHPQEYVLILPNLKLSEIQEPLTDGLQRLFENLSSFFHGEVSCCIGLEKDLLHLPSMLRDLTAMREDNLNRCNIPLFFSEYQPQKVSYTPPSLDVILTFLEQKQPDAAIANIEAYIHKLCLKNNISKDFLLHLRLDMEQIIYSFLQKNGIEAHMLLSTRECDELASHSLESIPYLLDYLRYLIKRAMDYQKFVHQEDDSVIDIVLHYIHQHYAEDLTRTMLADLVYLNPDYMARLFKKQTGASIISYITTYRIEKAKEFLQNPSLSISAVASKVGYGNYSYFSKLFIDIVGCTPNEYQTQKANLVHRTNY